MQLKVKLDYGAYMPTRAHETDAGADIRTPVDVEVPYHGFATIHTGVHVELPSGHAGVLKSKSGLNVKHNVISSGLIDEGYTGEIVVKLYNLGWTHVHLSRGTKITQLVVVPVAYPEFVPADEISGGPRGDSGFGSTGDR